MKDLFPKAGEKTEWSSLTLGNYAGKGTARNIYWGSRPQDVLDLACACHDLNFQTNALTISDAPYDNDPAAKSRLAKSNYIFWLMVDAIPGMTLNKAIIDLIGGIVLRYDKSDFLHNDGFINVINDDRLEAPDFLMIPYDSLSKESKNKITKIVYDDSFDGIGQSGGMKKFKVDYRKVVAEDCFPWHRFAESYWGDTWDEVCSI